jgi:pimeloyl-ACP methyl ester carboxylesterase
LVADIVALLDVLELDRVTVMAHDWGALVGFLLCLYHPARVERYVSLAIPHPFVRFNPRLLTALPRLWFQYTIATPVVGPFLLRKGRQSLARYLFEPARARRCTATSSCRYSRASWPGRFRSRRLSTPTLILYGSEDPNMNAAILGGYQDYSDDLTIEEVDGASHFIADERPQVVIDRALKFFG